MASKKAQCRMPDIISTVQEVTGLTRRESKAAIQAVVYSIKKGLIEKNLVRIPGFGKFVRISKGATERKSFGKMTQIPAKSVVKFRPLKGMKQLVNGELELEPFALTDDED